MMETLIFMWCPAQLVLGGRGDWAPLTFSPTKILIYGLING